MSVNCFASRRVLVVDDERTVADTLVIVFSNAAYEARAAYSAEQAIEVASQWLPDIAVLDVFLPEMQGIDLAKLFKAIHPTCRILLLSGQPSSVELVAQAAKEGHAFEILAKPIYPRLLLDRCAAMLGLDQPPDASQFNPLS